MRLVRLGLGKRYSQKANLTELAAMSVPDSALCFVTGTGLYEWRSTSTATADGSDVVASTALPAGKTNGRWHRVTTSWTYGAGGQNLGQKATGYLRAVEAFASDDGPDAALERVFGNAPAVLVQFTGDEPQSIDMTPGAFYRNTLSFQFLIISANMRPSPTATQGSPFPSEAAQDPGAYRIIGDLRRLLCGVAPDFMPGVERIEIGRAELGFEDIDRRLYVWTMDVRCRASFVIEDEDLADEWSIVAQPHDTAPAPDAATFDAADYLVTGGVYLEGYGSGLSRTLEATAAVIAGEDVTADPLPVTLDAESDVWRDLDPSDGWHITAIPAGSPPPALAAGCLRVGVTRTDSAGVVWDRLLCAFSTPTGAAVRVDVTA